MSHIIKTQQNNGQDLFKRQYHGPSQPNPYDELLQRQHEAADLYAELLKHQGQSELLGRLLKKQSSARLRFR